LGTIHHDASLLVPQFEGARKVTPLKSVRAQKGPTVVDFEGKTVVITAGANGMGRCIATRMSERGANIVVADIDVDAATTLAGQLASAVAVGCDVRSNEQIEHTRQVALDRFGSVDIVMSHAGIGIAVPVHETTDADWLRLLDLNVVGMARGVRAFVPQMLEQGSGHLILTSSSLALLGGHPISGLAGPYIASKAAVIGLAQALATALVPQGVGVTLFAPDATSTGFKPTLMGSAASPAAPSDSSSPAEKAPTYSRQTPEHAADVLMQSLDEGRFLASATPDYERLLRVQADVLLDPAALAAEY